MVDSHIMSGIFPTSLLLVCLQHLCYIPSSAVEGHYVSVGFKTETENLTYLLQRKICRAVACVHQIVKLS